MLGVQRISIPTENMAVREATIEHGGLWGGIIVVTFASSGNTYIVNISYYSPITVVINDNGGNTSEGYYTTIRRLQSGSDTLYITTNVTSNYAFIQS